MLGSDGDSVLEIESSPGYSASEMDLFKLCESSQDDLEERDLTEAGLLKVHEVAADSGLRRWFIKFSFLEGDGLLCSSCY